LILALLAVGLKWWHRFRPSRGADVVVVFGGAVDGGGARGYRVFPGMTRMVWFKIIFGVVFVTFFCPALSNYALFQISLGIALTLSSIGPIYALPLTFLFKSEPLTLLTVLWTVVAVAGVVILVVLG
jgi:drug/metabolite transporter (DMT)-like permease